MEGRLADLVGSETIKSVRYSPILKRNTHWLLGAHGVKTRRGGTGKYNYIWPGTDLTNEDEAAAIAYRPDGRPGNETTARPDDRPTRKATAKPEVTVDRSHTGCDDPKSLEW